MLQLLSWYYYWIYMKLTQAQCCKKNHSIVWFQAESLYLELLPHNHPLASILNNTTQHWKFEIDKLIKWSFFWKHSTYEAYHINIQISWDGQLCII